MILICPGQLSRCRRDIEFGLLRVQGRATIQASEDLALTKNVGCLAGSLVTVVGGVAKIETATASFGQMG